MKRRHDSLTVQSVTASRDHEPALLLDQAGDRLGCARSDLIIGRAAQQTDSSPGVEFAQLPPPHLFQQRAGFPPRLDPAFALGDLFRRPRGKTGVLKLHINNLPEPLGERNPSPESQRQEALAG